MPSSRAVRFVGIAFLFGVAACGNVSLTTDGGADGAAGTGSNGGTTGTAGTSGGVTGGSGGGVATGGSGGVATGGSGGGVATGGSGGQAGAGGSTGGSGGHAGAGGSTGGSTIMFELTVPTDKSFCEQGMGCSGPPPHITIVSAGKPVEIDTPQCSTTCSTACLGVACPAVCLAPRGTAVTGAKLTWDGTTFSMSTCGQGTTCYAKGHAPAGKYVARMCATPGTVSADGNIIASCTATGPAECVDVPFDYPGTSPVVGHLP